MAVTAGMLARAAATALSNEKIRKGIGWGLVTVLSPVILLIAARCAPSAQVVRITTTRR